MTLDLEKNQEKGIKLSLLFNTKSSENSNFDYTKDDDVYTVKHDFYDEKFFYCREKYQNNIFNMKEQKEITKNFDILFLARKSKKEYYELILPIIKFGRDELYFYNIGNLNNKMWLLQNTQKDQNNTFKYKIENKPYYLQENDIIKFGKIKYEIINLKINSKDNHSNNSLLSNRNKKFCSIFIEKAVNIKEDNSDLKTNEETKLNINDDNSKCKICSSSECTEENPLIKICDCNTYRHVNCLKKLLNDGENKHKNENENKTVISYKFNNFGCEVCLKPYPLNFNINNHGDLIECCLVDDLNKPENTNYMILESLTRIKNNKNIKNIFIVKLIASEITVGKLEGNDIIINDDTISRYHAIFFFFLNNGNISIINKGRYGTSILIKNNVKLNIGEKIYLQIGRTYIEAEVKELSPEEKEELKKKEKNKPNSNDEKEENDQINMSTKSIEMNF